MADPNCAYDLSVSILEIFGSMFLEKWQHVIALVGVAVAAVGATSAFFLTSGSAVSNDVGSPSCSVIFQGVSSGDIEVDFAQSLCGDFVSKASLRQAIFDSDFEYLRSLRFDEASIPQLADLLKDREISSKILDPSNSSGIGDFFIRAIDAGLDPNLLSGQGLSRTSLLGVALENGNVESAIQLLNSGAYPYVYSELWGRETRGPTSIYPLIWLKTLSASEVDKARLVFAMLSAGLAQFGTKLHSNAVSLSDRNKEDLNELVLEHRNTVAYSAKLIQDGANSLVQDQICERASVSGSVDWCALADSAKGYYYDPKRAGILNGFRIAELVGVYDGEMHFLAVHDADAWARSRPIGLVIVNRDLSRVEIYFHMANAAGLGHCSRLRARINGDEPGPFTETDRNARCWRYDRLEKTFGSNTYDNQGWTWQRAD